MTSLWIIVTSICIVATYTIVAVISDPQTSIFQKACSKYDATNPVVFGENRNKTLSDLRLQITSNDGIHFAISQQIIQPDPVYAMFQCRNYLNSSDCLACFDSAEAQIRSNCPLDGGARVFYDGCFLRYESIGFVDQILTSDNFRLCGNEVVSQETTFARAVDELLSDIIAATPKINGYFAASSREAGGGSTTAYAVAQCPERISPTGCSECLLVAYEKINSCLPQSEGRASDHGKFSKHSENPLQIRQNNFLESQEAVQGPLALHRYRCPGLDVTAARRDSSHAQTGRHCDRAVGLYTLHSQHECPHICQLYYPLSAYVNVASGEK
ncbi:Cysteine-rich receptor-like protein kinase [Thalictrum thalictroides]|uniref:Cysteine-rich receptor-like protein kinase n=1 Tax=Thalictrum thalictroides TaxID=46969 RepID=A0A7J6VUR3_THATH|nr:Cysteine-rich receptor-like protein kinase [Thalictrum thalictroides]